MNIANVLARKAAKRLGVEGERPLRFCSRLPTVAMLGLLLASTFLLGRSFFGPTAACVATLLTALDPNLVAHSTIATVDEAYALATLLTVFAGLAFARRPSLRDAALLGLALGFAFAVKFTAVLLLPGLVVLPWASPEPPRDRRAWGRFVGGLAIAAIVAVVVVCGAYLFRGIGTPLGRVKWRSGAMVAAAHVFPRLRVPLPVDFLTGYDALSSYDQALGTGRAKEWPVYILGGHYTSGVWYYYLVLWLLKTPLLLVAAQLGGLWRAARAGLLRGNAALRHVMINGLVHLGYFSILFRAQIGYRHALMCVPIGCLLAGVGLAPVLAERKAAVAVLVAACLAEGVPYLGNAFAFTNSLVWPKANAFRLMADTNLDYGQNNDKVKSWLADHEPDAHLNPVHLLPGRDAVGVTILAGAGRPRPYRWTREHLSPDAHFRHTLLLFSVNQETFERFLNEDRRLGPTPLAQELCGGKRRFASLEDGTAAVFSDEAGDKRRATIVCVSAPAGSDLVLEGETGRVFVGPCDAPRRDWDYLVGRREAWYRLDPGLHALCGAGDRGFSGRWRVHGSAIALRSRLGVIEGGRVDR